MNGILCAAIDGQRLGESGMPVVAVRHWKLPQPTTLLQGDISMSKSQENGSDQLKRWKMGVDGDYSEGPSQLWQPRSVMAIEAPSCSAEAERILPRNVRKAYAQRFEKGMHALFPSTCSLADDPPCCAAEAPPFRWELP